jgi:signal transduction histidine kinase
MPLSTAQPRVVRSPGRIRESCLNSAIAAAARTLNSQRIAYTHKLAFLTENAHDWTVRSPRQDIELRGGYWLVRRIRRIIALGVLAVVALFTLAAPDQSDQFQLVLIAALFLFCFWALYRPVARYERGERLPQAALTEVAHLEGVSLATRTVRHHLRNKLAVAIGYSELLVDDPSLPHELGEQAQKIMASALAAVETVDKLQDHIVRVQLDTSLAGPPLLDLDASTAVRPSGDRLATDPNPVGEH